MRTLAAILIIAAASSASAQLVQIQAPTYYEDVSEGGVVWQDVYCNFEITAGGAYTVTVEQRPDDVSTPFTEVLNAAGMGPSTFEAIGIAGNGQNPLADFDPCTKHYWCRIRVYNDSGQYMGGFGPFKIEAAPND